MSEDKLYSIPGAAEFLGGISKYTRASRKSTIQAWLTQGKLMRTKVGVRTMIRESQLRKVMEDGGKSRVPRKVAVSR